MARNGAGEYSLPAGYQAVTGATATAAQHNDPLEDLEADMNAARPIVAGGTGATTAANARSNLGLGSGSNANGNWQHLGGSVLMWGSITATYQSPIQMGGTVTYPVSLSGAPSLTGLVATDDESLEITNASFINTAYAASVNSSGFTVRVNRERDSGAGAYGPGNEMTVYWSAIGTPS